MGKRITVEGDPFEKALHDALYNTLYADRDDSEMPEIRGIGEARQALLTAHRAGLRAARANEAEISRNIMQRYTDLVAKGDFRDWLTSCKEDLLMPQDDRIKQLRDKI